MNSAGDVTYVKASTRLGILIIGAALLAYLSYRVTGRVVPVSNPEAAIFQSGLLMILMGSLLLEDKFTRPADAVVNAVTGLVCLGALVDSHFGEWWVAVFLYLAVVLAMGVTCIVLGVPGENQGIRETLSRVLYSLSTLFGKSQILFSVVFLFSLFTYYGSQSIQALSLLLFWGGYLALWPLRVPMLIQRFVNAVGKSPNRIGSVVRIESPNLVRAHLVPGTKWDPSISYVVCRSDRQQFVVCPLFAEVQSENVVGVGVVLDPIQTPLSHLQPGGIYQSPDISSRGDELLQEYYNLDNPAVPLGVVGYGSTIATLRFETWQPDLCREGLLVFVPVGHTRVYYQVVDGATREESFEGDLRGFHRATAVQLGVINVDKGFEKYPWLPEMNLPVFLASEQSSPHERRLETEEIVLGKIPGADIPIVGNINELITHHTAILGVTGTGKTEFAFELIREAVKRATKVFCIDLTGDYPIRLADLNPRELGLSETLARELSEKLFDAETGPYGAGQEKRVLKDFADRIRVDIKKSVEDFMADPDSWLGIFSLPDISNTKATLYATEIYVSTIFRYAKDNNSPDRSRIWVVLEEAHTVIPEAATMGLGDHESKAMVAKIAQIALQGRKYRVGLLVVAQRTANISKTILTQCNTIISFCNFDQTGLDFLSNFYGAEAASLIPNLRFLHAVAFGKGVYTERPVEMQVPYDESKAKGALRKPGTNPAVVEAAAARQV